MSSRLERYKRRQKIKNSITIYDSVEQKLVDKFKNSSVDMAKVDKVFDFTSSYYDMSVSSAEAEEFLERFKKEFSEERFNRLISDCKREVINSIVTPFGLGKYLAVYDKVGGNVDTIHNVREGIYATENEQNKYENRGEYNSDEYHKDKAYIEKNKQHSQGRKDGTTKDYLTGKEIKEGEKYDQDHVISAKEIHDDAGRVLADVDGAKVANSETNLKATTPTNNRSKKADSMEDFLKKKNERLEKKLETLKSKENLTETEKNELKKLEELKEIDDQKAMAADKEAREAYNKTINKEYYTSKKFIKNTLETSALEGSKMGMQQALGLIFVEFFTALFDEIVDIYKNGFESNFDENSFISILKKRIKRIGERLKAKWKDVLITFKDGAISGFISNLVTTLTNMFATTGKRIVRIIREGIFSLFKAIKTILFPPENLTFEEAMHEAKKLIASGIIVSVGVVLEEYVDTLIKTTAVLEPFSDVLTSVLIGGITGIAVTLTVYYIDKKKDDKELFDNLVCDTNKKFDELEGILYGFLK